MRARIRPIIIVAATAASFLVGVTPPAVAAAPTDPGALSHFDLARKDCLGTARNTTSKIWYTVAGGVLSDVYAPTIDTTNVETMQYLVTDGSTFTDLQTRDTTYTVSADATGMICTVTSTAKSRRVPADHDLPHRPGAGQRRRAHAVHAAHAAAARATTSTSASTRRSAATAAAERATAAPTPRSSTRRPGRPIPVSYDTVTTTNAANRDYAVPTLPRPARRPAVRAVAAAASSARRATA